MQQTTLEFENSQPTTNPAIACNTVLAEVTVGGLYELDGIRFRLTKWRESGIMTFQELNADGSDYITYYTNSEGEPTQVKDWGTRLIGLRLNEMVRVGK